MAIGIFSRQKCREVTRTPVRNSTPVTIRFVLLTLQLESIGDAARNSTTTFILNDIMWGLLLQKSAIDVDVASEKFNSEKYEKFMNTHYSSMTILLLIAGNCILNECIFRDFDLNFLPRTNPITTNLLWSFCSLFIRVVVGASLVYVWCVKTATTSTALSNPCTALAIIQAAFPIVMNIVFAVYIFVDLTSGSYTGLGDVFQYSPSYFAQYGLQAYPLVTFLMLRDTKPIAVLISWAIAIGTLGACCFHTRSVGELSSLLLYTVASATLFLDHHRQNRAMFAVVTKLEETLAENERLAVEAQAVELRAMIGNVAHDLKTPLTSILCGIECMVDIVKTWRANLAEGSAETFMRAAQEKVQTLQNCLLNMSNTVSFMTMTINRCLDYTKTTKGFKLVPKLETVDVRAKLRIPVQLILDTHSYDNIEIRVAPLDSSICTHIITDRQWLLENLLCLLSNAAKYSNKGCVDVSVELVPNPCSIALNSDDNSSTGDSDEILPQCLRFQVLDTGVGLSEEAMQGLFNPFKQAQRLAGGTGLGLFSLAKRVEAMHGQYGVARRPDGRQGSMFWFTIPYRPDTVSAKLAKRADMDLVAKSSPTTLALSFSQIKQKVASPSAPDQGYYRVMIVDDAPLVVKMVRMLLTGKGHKVEEKAVNGQEALEKLIHGYSVNEPKGEPPFDVVLMDLQMPVLDGIEAIRRLRAFEQSFRQDHHQQQQQQERADDHASQSGPNIHDQQGQPIAPIKTAHGSSIARKLFHQFVVAFSANSDHETKQAAMEAGADAFLSKPFSYESFIEVVRNFGNI